MRKLLIASLFLLAVSTFSLSAQQKFKREWTVGASFGTNLSQAAFGKSSSTEPFRTKMWQQYQGGIGIRYITEKNLGLIAEINYSQQGWMQDFSNKDEKDPAVIEMLNGLEHKHQLNYLEIPFLSHIYFGEKVRFFINLGPRISFLLSEKETLNDNLLKRLASGEMSSGEETAQYFKKADSKFDYGILVGLGVEFRTGIGHFSLEGRYNFGLSDFYSNKKSDAFQQSANRVIGVKLNYYVKVF